jgi:glutaredoxin
MKTVPAIYLENKLIGGYTDLIEYVTDNPGVI